jgi:2-methylisocitrate lyase-like PEP mutase family enzyme
VTPPDLQSQREWHKVPRASNLSDVIDRIGAYIESGADGLNIAFQPPVDWDACEAYIAQVLPVFHTS